MAEFTIIYILGYIVCFITEVECERRYNDILIDDLFHIIISSLFSWVMFVIDIFYYTSKYVSSHSGKIIFKKKNNGNKD